MPPHPARDSVLPLLEEATQAPVDSIDGAQRLSELEGWDSMGMVMFIGLVKARRGVELTVHDLRECELASELDERVAGRGGRA